MMETRAEKLQRRNLENPCCKADGHTEKSQVEIIMNTYDPGEDVIVAEILPRLPVKSLLKFRCVSKSWYSLISSSDFVNSHLKKSADDNSLAHYGMIASYSKETKKYLVQCSLRSWLADPSSFDVKDFTFMDSDFDEGRKYTRIVGTCNGLFCIHHFGPIKDTIEQFVLWNPATNKSFRLPHFERKLDVSLISGIGFDEANNDYKVLVFEYFNYTCISPLPRLYSSRTNSWKDVEGFKDRRYLKGRCRSAIFLNGKLHFCIIGNTRDSISCFDLEREEFGLLELPKPLSKSTTLESVGLLDGCLSCVMQRGYASKMRVWVMRQYGLKESWHLELSISEGLNKVPFSRSNHIPVRNYIPVRKENKVAICRAEWGEIMFGCHDGFMIYDPTRKTRRHLIWKKAIYLNAHIYVESLVSPVPESLQDTSYLQQ